MDYVFSIKKLRQAGWLILLLLSLSFILQSCYKNVYDDVRRREYLDSDLEMTHDDFKRSLIPRQQYQDQTKPKNDNSTYQEPFSSQDGYSSQYTQNREKIEISRGSSEEPIIPETLDIITAPVPPALGSDKLVSLSVTEDVSLKEVLIEVGRLADVDMEIDSGITGGVILRVKNKPFDKVIARIAELGGLRFFNKDGILRVERDLPYQINYHADFLNIIRSNTSSVAVNTKVLGATTSEGNTSESLTSGSSNSLTSSYDGDLWGSVENTLRNILAYKTSSLSSQLPGDLQQQQQINSSLDINKQAGVISVMATKKQHKIIEDYLNSVKKSVSSQVLIEAKIVEVTLDEEYRTGIDWGSLEDNNLKLGIGGKFDAGLTAAANFFTLKGIDGITTAVNMLEKFGASRTLSSPRLHAMNNQQAVLTFAENRVFFTIQVEEEVQDQGTADEQTRLTVESTLNTVPIGVILTLQPSINMDTQEITMNIRPTLSRVTGSVSDPAVDIVVARENVTEEISSEIPVIEVRELDSVLKIKSGEVMVIGGLMKETNINENNGIPYVNKTPVLGNLFKSVQKDNEVVETIIFIKATIVPTQGVGETDRHIYKKFMSDPRPLVF